MPTRRPLLTAALLAALLLLMLAGCNTARPTPTPPAAAPAPATNTPAPTPTTIPTPAATPAPSPTAPATAMPAKPAATPTPDAPATSPGEVSYAARDVGAISLTAPEVASGAASPHEYQERTVEEVLAEGSLISSPDVSPVHIAFRGTTEANSTRCQWLGIARTPGQREELIRLWFGWDDNAPIPPPDEVISQSMPDLNHMVPASRVTMLALIKGIAYGGVSTDYSFLACHVDYSVSEYLLGSGATAITATYYLRIPGMSYQFYQEAHAAGRFGDEPLLSKVLHEAILEQLRVEYENRYNEILQGRESVVFLVPMGAYQAIAVEAWLVAEQWDVQLVDGVLQAVRYGAGDHDEEYTQTLAGLKSRITTAAASDKFAGKRIANTEGLEAYYREIGAYDDITPGDGIDNPFTPAQPPPPHPTPSPP